MAIKKIMEQALNDQLKAESESEYLYLSMSAYFESINLKGMAHWMYVQFQEEQTHKMKFFRYINERGGRINFKDLKAPKLEWSSPLNVFEETLEHEQQVTELINNLVELAMKEKDYATYQFLQWYVSEQVEEEANVIDIIENIKRVQNSAEGLYMLDKELASRVFVDTTATAV